MKDKIWFKRIFNFAAADNDYQNSLDRIRHTPERLGTLLAEIPEQYHDVQHLQKWSIKEHIGHLWDLEPLWLGRIRDIMENKQEMRAADLENKKTHETNHNDHSAECLLNRFSDNRQLLLNELDSLLESDILRSSLHPRLKKPMRIRDLVYFVAEHDDHHLDSIQGLHSVLDDRSNL